MLCRMSTLSLRSHLKHQFGCELVDAKGVRGQVEQLKRSTTLHTSLARTVNNMTRREIYGNRKLGCTKSTVVVCRFYYFCRLIAKEESENCSLDRIRTRKKASIRTPADKTIIIRSLVIVGIIISHPAEGVTS